MDFKGASALVTGAASGIGASVARQLAAAGAHVVVADVQVEKGTALADEIGGVFAEVDVTRTEQIQAAVETALSLAPLRATVCSAGIGPAQRTIGRDRPLPMSTSRASTGSTRPADQSALVSARWRTAAWTSSR